MQAKLIIHIIILVLVILIFIMVFSITVKVFHESYVGSPLASMFTWDSGSKMRRNSQLLSSSNYSPEHMTGARDGPRYVGQWDANDTTSTTMSGTDYSNSAMGSTGGEHFSGSKHLEDNALQHHLY